MGLIFYLNYQGRLDIFKALALFNVSGAIRRLLAEHGPGWLGKGLLFLCNRWEKERFAMVMEAAGWPPWQWAVYDEGEDGEHFARWAYEVWRCAPLPRPANFLWYLPTWAEEVGLIPAGGVQAFTGLWANEVWHHWVRDNGNWPRVARHRYGIHMLASMPIPTQWVEYPLVTVPILDVLRRVRVGEVINCGNALRREVAHHALPEAARIRPRGLNDGYHPLSGQLRRELDGYYQTTEFGKVVPWQVPEHSGNSGDWGRWSMALLLEELICSGVWVGWTNRGEIRRGRTAKQSNAN